MTLLEIVEQAQALSIQDRKELVKILVDSLDASPKKRRLSELAGLGKEIWQGVDAQEYVDSMRDEWDENK